MVANLHNPAFGRPGKETCSEFQIGPGTERGVEEKEEEGEERRRGIDFASVVSLGRCGHTYMWFSGTRSKEADPKRRVIS